MALSIYGYGDIQQGGQDLLNFICDAESDVASLPTDCKPGSMAIVAEPDEGKSKLRILNNSGTWKEL